MISSRRCCKLVSFDVKSDSSPLQLALQNTESAIKSVTADSLVTVAVAEIAIKHRGKGSCNEQTNTTALITQG